MQNNEKPEEPEGVVIPIIMPHAGETMEEGTIIMWHVQPGDMIEKGQIIFEIETDKAAFEVEADHAGRLAKIVVFEGETVPAKTPVAYIADNNADVETYIAAQSNNAIPTENLTAPTPASVLLNTKQEPTAVEDRPIKASPSAKKLAREMGIDLRIVSGSGPGGRILSSDVQKACSSISEEPIRRPMSDMRKAVVRALVASKQNIPHFYVRQTIVVGPMYDFYQARKAEFKCSLNDVIMMASARAIKEFPAFRSRLDGEEIVEFPTANIGIVVEVEDGLLVPVVVGADNMTFRQIAVTTRKIVEKARKGKLEAIGKGVFTISNLGMFGVEEFAAIINPPEAAILAVGAVRDKVIVSEGAAQPAKVMTLTLSCDHRLIDGVLAARFMARLKEILENPVSLE